MKELVGLFLKHAVEPAVCGGFGVAYCGYVRATIRSWVMARVRYTKWANLQ